LDFSEKVIKSDATHVATKNPIFFQDFFGKSKIGHFFCPFFKKVESPGQKNLPPQHKNFLACQTKKKFLNLLR
jgi:hypothetical protein